MPSGRANRKRRANIKIMKTDGETNTLRIENEEKKTKENTYQ